MMWCDVTFPEQINDSGNVKASPQVCSWSISKRNALTWGWLGSGKFRKYWSWCYNVNLFGMYISYKSLLIKHVWIRLYWENVIESDTNMFCWIWNLNPWRRCSSAQDVNPWINSNIWYMIWFIGQIVNWYALMWVTLRYSLTQWIVLNASFNTNGFF